jgi:lysophospholipase L1-like esterase
VAPGPGRATLRGRVSPRSSPPAAAALLASCAALAACHKAALPTAPSPPPVPTYSITATVFYDENGNGQLDPGETVRIPGVEVVIGTGVGKSEAGSGQAVVTGIQEGVPQVGVRLDSVPYYFQPLPAGTVQVPGGASEVRVPLTLPIGRNQPNTYFGYGDSITAGEGSTGNQGYPPRLASLLTQYLGRAVVTAVGRSGTDSAQGEVRAPAFISRARAAYVLILYGTNDWQDQTCQTRGPDACFTVDKLREIVSTARGMDSLPVLADILPVNPAKAPAGRNQWIDQMNAKIKVLAQQEQVPFADVNAAFKANPVGLVPLFSDDVHPNDAGYQVLAQAWFGALTRGRSAASASRRFGFSFH